MKSIIYFLIQAIVMLCLANILLSLVPSFIRRSFKFTFKTMYKTIKFMISLVIKQVKSLYVDQDKKKVVRKYTRKKYSNTKKSKQPSNVVQFKPKKTATK